MNLLRIIFPESKALHLNIILHLSMSVELSENYIKNIKTNIGKINIQQTNQRYVVYMCIWCFFFKVFFSECLCLKIRKERLEWRKRIRIIYSGAETYRLFHFWRKKNEIIHCLLLSKSWSCLLHIPTILKSYIEYNSLSLEFHYSVMQLHDFHPF